MMETLSRLIDILSYDPAEPMIFSSGLFLYLFLGFTFVYYLLRRRLDARLLFVTLFSYYFYYKSSGIYFFLLAVVTVSDFLLARSIYLLRHDRRRRKWLLALSLGIDLGLLAYFKYTNFFAGMVAQMVGCNFQPWDIFLPVGISFFTFQSMSYTIDVYRGRLKPLHRLLDYAFYVSFFPQLVAGPIVRASEFVPQIRRKLHISRTMFAQGVLFVAMGLLKKAVVSDYISLNFVDRVFDNPTLFSGGEVLLGLYGYSIQIYCDFSGYSDMAIGIALLLGFRFPQNFNAPYKASSVSDFWRRWHISLSSWIRDYVYISLGGNRHGRVRMYLNQMVSMTLCGLWHGASLNFVVWGAMHGLPDVGVLPQPGLCLGTADAQPDGHSVRLAGGSTGSSGLQVRVRDDFAGFRCPFHAQQLAATNGKGARTRRNNRLRTADSGCCLSDHSGENRRRAAVHILPVLNSLAYRFSTEIWSEGVL